MNIFSAVAGPRHSTSDRVLASVSFGRSPRAEVKLFIEVSLYQVWPSLTPSVRPKVVSVASIDVDDSKSAYISESLMPVIHSCVVHHPVSSPSSTIAWSVFFASRRSEDKRLSPSRVTQCCGVLTPVRTWRALRILSVPLVSLESAHINPFFRTLAQCFGVLMPVSFWTVV